MTFVRDLAGRLRCSKCAKAGRRPAATLLKLAQRPRKAAPEICRDVHLCSITWAPSVDFSAPPNVAGGNLSSRPASFRIVRQRSCAAPLMDAMARWGIRARSGP
jgi:hypothetical protein